MWLGVVDAFFADFDRDDPLVEVLHFFVYDSVKIFFLLFVIIFFITLLRSYFPVEKIRDFLGKKNPFFGHVSAAIFGIITPFCSCSAIPLFLGFLQARIPLGVTFSYLVSAPMNNEIAIAMLFSLFGWKVTAIYIALGLLVAICAGVLIGALKLEKEVLIDISPAQATNAVLHVTFPTRVKEAFDYTLDIIKKIALYVLVGVGLGGFIHEFVPSDYIASIAGGNGWYAVPLATIFGVPMYSNAAGVMPLVEVLTSKGMLMGTALSFMMAIIALSLPEAMILKRILSTKLIGIFFSIVAFGIMIVGYVFNMIL